MRSFFLLGYLQGMEASVIPQHYVYLYFDELLFQHKQRFSAIFKGSGKFCDFLTVPQLQPVVVYLHAKFRIAMHNRKFTEKINKTILKLLTRYIRQLQNKDG